MRKRAAQRMCGGWCLLCQCDGARRATEEAQRHADDLKEELTDAQEAATQLRAALEEKESKAGMSSMSSRYALTAMAMCYYYS